VAGTHHLTLCYRFFSPYSGRRVVFVPTVLHAAF
jgi:hypothetical protein